MLSPRTPSPRIALRGASTTISIAARPLCRRAANDIRVANPAMLNRRNATGIARTPIRPRPSIDSAALACGDDDASSPPPASASASASASTSSSTSALVDALLASVAGASADRGASMSPSERAAADALFDELVAAVAAEGEKEKGKEEMAKPSSSSSSPLDSPFLLGDFDVAYVSTGRQQKGQPAGGRFRSGVGRALLQTRALCQSIFFGGESRGKGESGESGKPPLLVTNKVAFRLAGVLEGSIGLRGRVTASFPSCDWKKAEEEKNGEGEETIGEKEKRGGAGGGGDEVIDAVRVDFDPAVLSLLPNSEWFRLFLRIGRPSWVALATPYGESLFFFF